MSGVLVIDQSFRPIDVLTVREAAESLATGDAISGVEMNLPGATVVAVYRSPSTVLEIPSVIMLKVCVPIPKKLSRHITNTLLFARDGWTCQYCGRHEKTLLRGEKLTRDHVKPQSLFSHKNLANTWDNVVTACSTCNNKKDNKLPYQCGMYPIKTPKRPEWVLFTLADKLTRDQWDLVKGHLKHMEMPVY